MVNPTKKQLEKKEYKLYPFNFSNYNEALLVSQSIKKYRYFSNYAKYKKEYLVYYKKQNYILKSKSKVWKSNDDKTHYYSGIQDTINFSEKFSNEWNIFCTYNESLDYWVTTFYYYNKVCSHPKIFYSKHNMYEFINILIKKDRYTLRQLDNYKDIIL